MAKVVLVVVVVVVVTTTTMTVYQCILLIYLPALLYMSAE